MKKLKRVRKPKNLEGRVLAWTHSGRVVIGTKKSLLAVILSSDESATLSMWLSKAAKYLKDSKR